MNKIVNSLLKVKKVLAEIVFYRGPILKDIR